VLSLASRLDLQLIPEPVLDLDGIGAVDTEILAAVQPSVLAAEVPVCQGSGEDDSDTRGEVHGERQDVSRGVGIQV
jgi:hypothetical protein